MEALIRQGHSDLQGLLLALSDWSMEMRVIRKFADGGSDTDDLVQVLAQLLRESPTRESTSGNGPDAGVPSPCFLPRTE